MTTATNQAHKRGKPRKTWPSCSMGISFRIGEAIPCAAGASAEEFHALRRVRREAEGALHELIELELARRCGIDLR